jgi:hypothetical protein
MRVRHHQGGEWLANLVDPGTHRAAAGDRERPVDRDELPLALDHVGVDRKLGDP